MIEWKNGPGGITPEDRRDYIHGMLAETTYGQENPENGVIDLLVDLQHYCHLMGIDFNTAVPLTALMFEAEKVGHVRATIIREE
jgi:hypothetical protein